MNMYFKVSKIENVEKIDNALLSIDKFDDKLKFLQEAYKADKPYVFNSLDRGIEFSNLWFENYPFHLDTKTEFKLSKEKYKTGYEARPRKTNKKFYKDFMKDLVGANYHKLKLVLFGVGDIRASIEYTKTNNEYYVMSSTKIIIESTEITASQYMDAIKWTTQ